MTISRNTNERATVMQEFGALGVEQKWPYDRTMNHYKTFTANTVARFLLGFTLFTTGCASSVGTDGGGTDTGPANGPCPATLPTANASCSRTGLVCQYGDDPRVSCRPSAMCTASGWMVHDAPCTALAACPDLADGAAGQTCSTMGDTCGYANMACTCTNCGPPYPVQMCSGPTTWHCDTAPGTVDMGCPSPIANLGTACSQEGLLCRYDCEGRLARTCTGGVWVSTPQGNMCPLSMRSAKRDIRYLDASEVDDMARSIERTPLATYEYIDPSQPAGRHLGFIIDDQPPASFAVAADGHHVDMYGYTSMLLAAVQSQQRQIDALRDEVARLRGERCAHR